MSHRNAILIVLSTWTVLTSSILANAYTIPVTVTAGNISVSCVRILSGTNNPYGYTVPAGYDEVDFFLTGMLGSAAGKNIDGSQCRINCIQGHWTAHRDATGAPTSSGGFWLPTNMTTFKNNSTNGHWEVTSSTTAYSTVNFDSIVSGATIWTNTAPDVAHGLPFGGGRDPAPTGSYGIGSNYKFFSGSWYTADYNADLVYPPNPGYDGMGTDSRYLAALCITSSTPDAGIAYDGVFGFTYGGGSVEVVHFYTSMSMSGDANGDGKVDIIDLNKVLTSYNKTGMVWADGDFDSDGTVTVADLNKVLTNYNKSTGVSVEAVPEPGALGLMLAGAVGLLAFAWRRRACEAVTGH